LIKLDPKPRNEKEREKIAKDIEQYLANGGEIKTVTSEDNANYGGAMWLNKKQLVALQKGRTYRKHAAKS